MPTLFTPCVKTFQIYLEQHIPRNSLFARKLDMVVISYHFTVPESLMLLHPCTVAFMVHCNIWTLVSGSCHGLCGLLQLLYIIFIVTTASFQS